MVTNNPYVPQRALIQKVIRHTKKEHTFRLAFEGEVKPGQFFEVSLPKYGEAPISVSAAGPDYIELTIRNTGRVTEGVFACQEGDHLGIRGPYGNGFDPEQFKGKDLLIVSGGTGAAPVHGLIDYFAVHPDQRKSLTILSSFKREDEILFLEDYERWSETSNVMVTLTRETKPTKWLSGRPTNYISDLRFDDIREVTAIIVGPEMLMKNTAAALIEQGMKEENIWVSQERKMCCGLGKCGHCRIGEHYICLDGPVFNYTESLKLID